MSFQITLDIAEDSPEGRNIENMVETQNISREEAALRLLAEPQKTGKASPEALSFLGAFRDDAELMDEIVELVMSDRERHNAEPPRV